MQKALVLCFLVLAVLGKRDDSTMQLMLDQMEILMTGNKNFDPAYFKKLVDGMDDQFLETQNVSWQGMIDYYNSNGTATDRWGMYKNQYLENNMTRYEYDGIEIFQPCNYASNVAYYHVYTSMQDYDKWNMDQTTLKALEESYASLAYCSAFWHASQTLLGNVTDNRLIDLVSYIAHQASLSNLKGTSVIHELSETPRSKSGVETNTDLNTLLRTRPPSEWMDAILAFDMPSYYVTFSGLVTTMFTLIFPESIVDLVIPLLMKIFPLEQEVKDFILNKYIPELRSVTADVKVSIFSRVNLFFKVLGTLGKLIFAFLWQEHVFPFAIFKNPFVNDLGALIMPDFNELMNKLTGFTHTDSSLQDGHNIYPGDTWCRKQQPHSKWHEQSASGLLDLMFLSDYMLELTLWDKKCSSFLYN